MSTAPAETAAASEPVALATGAAAIARLTGVERQNITLTLGSGWGKAADVIGETVAAVPATFTVKEGSAERLDEKWLVDITERWTGEGKLYLCAFKDVCSNRVGGYAIDRRMKASLAVSALTNALTQWGFPEGVSVHSDRGSQFRSRKFQQALKHFKLRGSMGRVGACGDNAAMESFFRLLQKNVLDRQLWVTRQELRLAIVAWIEGKYHRKRRQRRLGKLTPVEFETIMMNAVGLAAYTPDSTKPSADPPSCSRSKSSGQRPPNSGFPSVTYRRLPLALAGHRGLMHV